MKAAVTSREKTGSTFGQEIRRLRRAKEVTLMDLCDRMGWSITYLCDVERGRRGVPKLRDVERLLEHLDCPDRTGELLIKAAAERGSIEIDLAQASPEIVDLSITLARRIQAGLAPSTAIKIRRALTTSS